MKFKVKTLRGKRPLVVAEFEEKRYALAGELLLAERPFLTEIISALQSAIDGEEAAAFSGNAFSLSASPDETEITNDISGEKVQAPTRDLLKLAKAYKKQYDCIKH